MGKKGYGKRIMRLDKQERRDISGIGEAGGPRGRQPKGGVQQAQAQQMQASNQSNMHLSAMLQLAQAGPKRVSRYSNRQRVLIVGDGDFSFSLSVASSVGGSNLVCTSLDKRTQVQVKYGQGVTASLQALERMSATLLHEVDATKLSECKPLAGKKFDRIVFNFPDLAEVAPHEEAKEVTSEPLSAFLASATNMLQRPGGEIHVAVRSRDLATLGQKVKEAALPHGLECGQVSAFEPNDFMGYRPRHTYPNSPKAVSLVPAKLLVFTCLSNEAKRKRREEEEEEKAALAAAEAEDDDESEEEEEVVPEPKKKKKKKRRTGWDDAKKDNPWLKAPKAKESKATNHARSAVAALFGR